MPTRKSKTLKRTASKLRAVKREVAVAQKRQREITQKLQRMRQQQQQQRRTRHVRRH